MIAAPSEGRVRSLSRRLTALPSPLELFSALTSGGAAPNVMLLESAEPTSRLTQRSILVVSSAVRFTCRKRCVRVEPLNPNGKTLVPFLKRQLASFHPCDIDEGFECSFEPPPADASDAQRLRAPSPLSVLRTAQQSLTPETGHSPDAVLLTGLFAYDLVAQFESLPDATTQSTPADVVPDFVFLLADQIVSIDHLHRHAEVVVNVFGGEGAAANHFSGVERLARIAEIAQGVTEQLTEDWVAVPTGEPQVDIDDDSFGRLVEQMKSHIVAGDVFQIVPSRSFAMDCRDPLAAYQSLRDLNPSPYLFFGQFGDFALLGASPESAVKVDGTRRTVEISPIAGTRRRGLSIEGEIDPELDCRLEAELRLDAKENAEHMMLVDLARNDVARVARSGTRRVVELARVVRYSHVMHLVSRIEGILADGLDALHAYQASMNMGTLTGAPKIKAMELIRRYENNRRGHYGGAVGYLRGDGSMDTAIVIRAALVREGRAQIRAGAGVVHDSVPQMEADETRRKADAVLRAIARANKSVRGGAP